MEGPTNLHPCYGLEVASPIFHLGSSEINDIEKVCNIITSTYKVFVNETCGLYVHVGKGRDDMPSDQEIKNLYAILWTFENRLTRLHPSHRQGNEACKSMHAATPLAKRNLSSNDALQRILNCQSGAEVIFLVSKSVVNGEMAYDGCNLMQSSGHAIKRTIEFRQHAGTLDPEVIVNWATVCATLLKIAGEISEAGLYSFLRDNLRDERTFTAVDLIGKIGLERKAEYYRSKLGQ